MSTAYRIRDWGEHFETPDSKRYQSIKWISTPIKQDGKGRRRLVRRDNGAALFGAWNAMVQVAARCPERGVLADDDGPLDADDLEIITDLPAALFEELFDLLTDPAQRINWLDRVEWPTGNHRDSQEGAGDPVDSQESTGTPVNACESVGGPAHSQSTKRNETKPNTKHDETEQNETERDEAEVSLSLDSNSQGASLSRSLSPAPVNRNLARVKFGAAIEPLIGMRNGGRLPRGDPGHEADLTCVRRIWEDVWPEHGDEAEGRRRYEQVMRWIESAKTKRTPMAWLQDKLKREAVAA